MTVAFTLRRFLRSAPFAAAQRLVPEDALDLLRRKLFPMKQAEACRVLAGLLTAEVPFVLAGGWAVDALVTELRRRHSDLDVIASPEVVPLMISVLAGLGYLLAIADCEGGWWAPHKMVLRSGGGGRIEVLVLAAQQWDPLVRRAAALLGVDVDRAPVPGHIGGLEVPCLPAALQLATHDGFAMNRDQRSDSRLLVELARR